MKFLIDAQLPRRLATHLQGHGHDALHTLAMLFVQASFVEMTQNGRPSLLEQSMIVKRLDSQERLVLAEKRKMEKLLRLKTGLMQDLLTGKVRVKADDGEVVR